MKAPLTVLVACGSWHIGARVIQRLSEVKGVDIIGHVTDAGEALGLIESLKPKLVILDAHLSHGTGIGVLRAVKESVAGTIVIMLSASSYPQYRKECLKEGADFYFHLPDEMEELKNSVRDLARAGTARSIVQE